jgi:hypothetical protein
MGSSLAVTLIVTAHSKTYSLSPCDAGSASGRRAEQRLSASDEIIGHISLRCTCLALPATRWLDDPRERAVHRLIGRSTVFRQAPLPVPLPSCTATTSASYCLLSNRETAALASFSSSASATCAKLRSTFACFCHRAHQLLQVHSESRVLVLDLADSKLLHERR